MIERTYQFSHTLTLELRDWCLLNNIEVDIYHAPPGEINSANGRVYFYAGKSTIKFITRSESADLMLRLKVGDSIHLIQETFQS